MAQTWGVDLIDRIGEEIARRRKDLELSAQQVADRTAELGHPVSRSAIADLSNPRRPSRLTVPDWLVLAAALEMPPLALLFPGAPAGDVEALPGWTVPAQRAFDWAHGSTDGPPGSGGAWASMLAGPQSWAQLLQEIDWIEAEISTLLLENDDPGRLRAAREELRDKQRELARHAEWAQKLSDEAGYGWQFGDPDKFVRGYWDGEGPDDG